MGFGLICGGNVWTDGELPEGGERLFPSGLATPVSPGVGILVGIVVGEVYFDAFECLTVGCTPVRALSALISS